MMAEGVTSRNYLILFAIVFAILSFDVFCPVRSSTGTTSTTPWPELGAKKPSNNKQQTPNLQTTTARNQNFNNNNGFQLSYGSNSNLNRNTVPQRLNSPHNAAGPFSGLALSYGPGQATHVPNPKAQSRNSQSTNQNINLNVPKPIEQNSRAPMGQNVPKPVQQNVLKPVQQNVLKPIQQNTPSPVQANTPNPLQVNTPKPAQVNTPKLVQQNVPKPVQQNTLKPTIQQNINQGAWNDRAKTQQVIGNLGSTTIKPNFPPITPSVQTPSSTVGPTKPGSSTQSPAEKENEELRQFFEQLIKKDNGNAAQQVTVNYQGKTTSRSTTDEAPLPLLDIRPSAYDIPSVSKLLALHNNYILETNVNEHVTPQERQEENDLLDSIVGTPVMQAARNFLVQKGILSKDPKDFRDKLKEIWFTMYSRGGGRIGSSGFEHVFLTEIKQNDVSGLHNWLYFKDAEAKGLANYLGYLKRIDLGNKGAILKHHFTFNGLDKPVGSMFIGTSPELEIALYSTCFLLRPDQVCPMRYDGKNFIIRTYTFRYRGKNMIGSAFPEI